MPVTLLFTGYSRHPKLATAVAKAGPWVEVLWVRALDYCNEHGTDGLIPPGIPDVLIGRPAKKFVTALVEVNSWEQGLNGAFIVHDFEEWNRPAAELAQRSAAKSEAKSRAGKAGAAKRWGSRLPAAANGADHG